MASKTCSLSPRERVTRIVDHLLKSRLIPGEMRPIIMLYEGRLRDAMRQVNDADARTILRELESVLGLAPGTIVR